MPLPTEFVDLLSALVTDGIPKPAWVEDTSVEGEFLAHWYGADDSEFSVFYDSETTAAALIVDGEFNIRRSSAQDLSDEDLQTAHTWLSTQAV